MKPLDAVQEIFTLKTGNIQLEQEPFQPENHESVAHSIIRFRRWRAAFENQRIITVQDVPNEFYDLFALLVHESNESLETLAIRINALLTPFILHKEGVESFKKVIKEIIKVVAHQEEYGLGSVVLLIEKAPFTIPERFVFYRWQAHDTTAFPLDLNQAAYRRREIRKQFSSQVTRTFLNLAHHQQLKLLNTKDENKIALLQRLDSLPLPSVPPLFTPFQTTDYTTLAPLLSFQPPPIASNFTTLVYAGLDPTIDLKQRFFQSLSSQAKAKRGYTLNLDIYQAIQQNAIDSLDRLRMKLLLFHEDVRQPYYGTCSMTSQDISGLTPFGQDKQLLDYEEDSELEWDHDVDIEDIHDLMLSSPIAFDPSTSEEDDEDEEEDKREDRWIVPDGCLTYSPRKGFVVSRPAQRQNGSLTHFMQPIVLGPSFESLKEYENHPLSDSKLHRVEEHPVEGCTLFEEVCMDKEEDEDVKDMVSSQPLAAVYDEGGKNEFIRLSKEDQSQLILAIQENQSKSLMHMMNSIRSKRILMDYSSDQLQAIIYEIAAPEVRGDSREYMWYLKPAIQ